MQPRLPALLHSAARRPTRPLTALLALALAAVAPRVYAQVRIGVVNIRRAVAETNEGRSATGAIKARFDERQRDLDQRSKAIERLKGQLERPVAGATQASLQRIAQRLQKQVVDAQSLGQQYTEEIQVLEAQMTKGLLERMQPIVREIALGENYQMIVDEQMVHYAPNNINLTDRVIQIYNQRNPADPTRPPRGWDAGTFRPPPIDNDTVDVPSPRMADAGVGATPRGMDAGVARPPVGPAASPDAGIRTLPGIFFRRDAGR